MIRIYSPIAALLILYGWMGSEDLKAQQDDAAYTQEIMERAKQEALAKAEYNRLVKRADEMLALGDMK